MIVIRFANRLRVYQEEREDIHIVHCVVMVGKDVCLLKRKNQVRSFLDTSFINFSGMVIHVSMDPENSGERWLFSKMETKFFKNLSLQRSCWHKTWKINCQNQLSLIFYILDIEKHKRKLCFLIILFEQIVYLRKV